MTVSNHCDNTSMIATTTTTTSTTNRAIDRQTEAKDEQFVSVYELSL